MDLDEFEIHDASDLTEPATFSAPVALEYFDSKWYAPKSKLARWMDLLGDYAGSELFIVDGESLLQTVLDDPMLAIGRQECSFQILHALLSLERMVHEFLRRSAVFEIVFWKANRHGTLLTGSSQLSVASRSLARCLLMRHLLTLHVPVHEFETLSDKNWLQYEQEKKPMFVMTNDGGLSKTKNKDFAIKRILSQRVLLFDLLNRGLAVTSLDRCEFRDSKIISFVFEQRLDPKGRELFPKSFWDAVALARSSLDAQLQSQQPKTGPVPLTMTHKHNVTKSTCLLALSQSFLSLTSPQDIPLELLYCFIVHCLLLDEISVRERARPLEALHPKLERIIISSFLPKMFFVAESIVFSSGLFLDFDGRVFQSLIRFFTCNPTQPTSVVIGHDTYARVSDIWSNLDVLPPDFQCFAARFPAPSPPAAVIATKVEPLRILPFDNEVFNLELSSVQITVDTGDNHDLHCSPTHLEFGQGIPFTDTQHWHNHKKAIVNPRGKDPRPADEWQRRKLLKKEQRWMDMLQRQAGTLTGASGASLHRIVVLRVGSPGFLTSSDRTPFKVKEPSKKAPKQGKDRLTSAEKLRKDILAKKQSKDEISSLLWWKGQLELMKKLTNGERITQLDALNRNKRSKERSLEIEMNLYRIHVLLSQWNEEPEPDSADVHDRYTVSIIRTVKEIYDRGNLTPTISTALSSVLVCLGFSGYARSLEVPSSGEGVTTRPLSFEFIKLLKSKSQSPIYKFMHIKEHPVVWQLRLFGPFMDRSMDSQPDPRVSFEPDAWQREVLNCIDQNESLLVVAPTSAGKTFISYYAMEKVLRNSDDGVLVYVAPTKALVTQIAAEVYARFSKDLNGRSCWSIHTRDFRIHDPQKCQILITVPEILSIMLLSPPLARAWTPRIKRIILDEIHSIGLESGTVWESILLLAPCPIIGLSATIGQPEIFNNWLEAVQKAHGFKHTFISHPHRFSHLRKFFYALEAKPKVSFTGLDVYESSQRARFLHPIAMLSFGPRSMPADLALEAADTLTLYRALASCQDVPDVLEPSKFFPDARFLRQKDIVLYEEALKGVVSSMISSFHPNDTSSPLREVLRTLEDPLLSRDPALHLSTHPTREQFEENLIYLVSDLHATGDLPAILFNFDRSSCEKLAKNLLEALKTSEETWRSSSPAWNRQLRQWEQWKLGAKERENLTQKRHKRREDKDEPEPVEAKEHSWESSFDPSDPSPQFSFAGTHTSYSKADLNQDIDDLRWANIEPWVIDALRRGIAVHHAGMNKRYRNLVESLFRQRFVRIVIATGTLALGINAPTKTCVLCGDSPFLTALMFRQCAGRAGRRGYDLLGKVVFYGLAMDRVQRLILSKLPPLGGGNFPLTSTMCLRLFNLLEGSGYAPVAVNAVQSIMKLPQISFGSQVGREQLLHHLRFSIDYLRRARLLDQQGRPQNLFGVAGHLYYTEPSNFALVTLMQKGILHQICAEPNLSTAKRDLIQLLCHLFGRRPLPASYTTQKNIDLVIKKSPSMVVLPPLRKDAHKVLVAHDQEVLRVFSAYALTFASQYASHLGPDCELPLSHRRFQGDPISENSQFRRHLRATAISVVARSPFIANSGHGDDFTTVEELTRTVRQGLHLNEHAIPSLRGITAERGRRKDGFAMNAYLLDFYIHGQVAALFAANGIRRGEIWYLLEDFMLTLKTIRETLVQLLSKASQESEKSVEENELEEQELDSGYGSLLAEMDEMEEGSPTFKRPERVKDVDWRVYEVMESATREFEEKFKAMWA